MTTAQPRRSRRARAEASGSSGSRTTRVGRAGVGGVDARVGADEAVARAADQAAGVGSHELGGLAEDHLDRPRVLAVLGGELARALAGRHVGEPDDAALGLADDLVGDHEHVGRQQLDPGAREQRREVVARAHLGQPGQGLERDHPAAAAADSIRASSARVRGATPGRPASASCRAWRSSGVSTSRPSERTSRDAHLGPGRVRARRVAGEGAGAEGGLDHVGRGEQQRVGAGAVAVGHDHHARAARSGRAARRSRRGRARGSRRGRAAPARHRPRAPRGRRSAPPRTGRPRADRGRRTPPRRGPRRPRAAPRSRR